MDRWLQNPNVVKVVALLLAILLWAVVHLENHSTVPSAPLTQLKEKDIYNVSVTPVYDTRQFFVESIDPGTVRLVLKGKEEDLKVNPDSYSIQVDLTKVGKGTHLLPLKAVGFPPSVSVETYPSEVKVVMDEKQKKEIPVEINLKGTPADGYKAGEPIVKPNRVHITVPSHLLDVVVTAKAEININEVKSAITKQVKLVAYDKNGKVVDGLINPPVVDVVVPVTRPFKTIPLVMKVIGQPPKGYAVASFKQTPEQITVYGSHDTLNRLDFYEAMNIDLSGLTKDKRYLLDIPLKAHIVQVDPKQVQIDVKVVPSAVKTLSSIPITIIGQSDGYEPKLTTPSSGTVNLKLEGAPSILDKITAADVQTFVDVSNLPPGKHVLPLNLNLPQFVKNAADQPLKVTVEIIANTSKSTGTK